MDWLVAPLARWWNRAQGSADVWSGRPQFLILLVILALVLVAALFKLVS
jgi:hypothetical protein